MHEYTYHFNVAAGKGGGNFNYFINCWVASCIITHQNLFVD